MYEDFKGLDFFQPGRVSNKKQHASVDGFTVVCFSFSAGNPFPP